MLYDYMVYIKNDKGRYINTIGLFLCLISAAFFLKLQINAGKGSYFYLASFCLVITGLAWNAYSSLRKGQIIYYRRMLIVAAATWLYIPQMQWLAIPYIFLALIEKHSKLPLEIGITNDRVVFNTLIKRQFYWQAFNNVMLKDGMLTLDFRSNRLFQKETIEDISRVDEYEFNEYCKDRLAKALPSK